MLIFIVTPYLAKKTMATKTIVKVASARQESHVACMAQAATRLPTSPHLAAPLPSGGVLEAQEVPWSLVEARDMSWR